MPETIIHAAVGTRLGLEVTVRVSLSIPFSDCLLRDKLGFDTITLSLRCMNAIINVLLDVLKPLVGGTWTLRFKGHRSVSVNGLSRISEMSHTFQLQSNH